MGRISRRARGCHGRRLPLPARVMDITADAPTLPQPGLQAARLAFHTAGKT